jgi:lysophospholipase L1-like esterase
MTANNKINKNKPWYWAIAISLPFVFFGGIEGVLRISSYGVDYPLFIENPANSNYLLPRPDIVKRYFAANANIPSVTMEANFLLKDKPQNGYRLFVQGGSTAAGFPYGLGASLAGMLDKRLKATLPEHNVEVVNTALAAVNSYTVLDLTDEIIAQQPDAVLVYLGHNEYLGILGVGSNYTAANSHASTLLFLKLRTLRIFQLLQNSYTALRSESAPLSNEATNPRTFMAKVAKHKDIPLDSALYKAGLEQFSDNLNLILNKYQQAGIPVYLSTIASNLLDQKPFSSSPLDTDTANAIQQIKIALTKQDQQKSLALAQQLTSKVNSLHSAMAHFELGRLYAQMQKQAQAKLHLTLARDLDGLRFRAPSAVNAIIRAAATKFNGVILVETEAYLSQHSPLGLIGNNVMLEHLHPNVKGYFLLADSFYQALAKHSTLADWHTVDISQAWAERPLIPAEEYSGFAKILQLMNDYPFTEPSIDGKEKPLSLPITNDWQLDLGKAYFLKQIDWLTMMQRSLARYQADNNLEMSLKTAVILAEALPHNAQINDYVAQRYTQTDNQALASYYRQRAALAAVP